MIAITSISPGHTNFENQFNAVRSWIAAGYKVVSLNSKEEIEKLSAFEGVEFVETQRTNERLFKKPYVTISAIIDHLKTREDDYFLIVNSDIIIKDSGIIDNIKSTSENGLVIINRYDFEAEIEMGIRYNEGFDGFFINKKWLSIFPQSVLCLGQCFWDFWVPYQGVLSGTPIYRLNEPYLFHKKHPVQYSYDNWISTGELFRGEVSCLDRKVTTFRDVPRMSGYVFTRIKHNLK